MLVRNNASKFGENAGKVWHVIASNGQVTIDQLRSETGLSEKDLYAAVGWLARENKVKKDHEWYRLDDTNLDDEIGTTAGKVYKILDIWEQADVTTIERLSDQSNEEIYAAIGWLAREDKIASQSDQKFSLKYE